MKTRGSSRLTRKQSAELMALAGMPEDQIDKSDMPEVRDWSGAKRGLLYRPIKKQLTLRIDADVIAWFKDHAPRGEGYQTDMNRALREYIKRRSRLSKAS
ncbi:MAG: BrnA antitoxin family protein [Proteobacteria bacterium]|nr:BrnA antitoxin family protein [Pseudomonadota bacterium]MBI3498305.1 BrnA antitoxin family protein [Pseudomonadota bacterium]